MNKVLFLLPFLFFSLTTNVFSQDVDKEIRFSNSLKQTKYDTTGNVSNIDYSGFDFDYIYQTIDNLERKKVFFSYALWGNEIFILDLKLEGVDKSLRAWSLNSSTTGTISFTVLDGFDYFFEIRTSTMKSTSKLFSF